MADPVVHRVSAEWEPLLGAARPVEITSEQLHGRACVDCGSMLDGLMAAGHVYTPGAEGGRLGWPVKACPQHTGEAAAA
jgi:hypothetical protein